MTGILPTLLRRKKLLLMCGMVTACIAFAVSLILPLQYSSEGSLILESRVNPADGGNSPSVLNNVLTQVDVLQSKGLIQRTVRDHDLAHMAGLVPTTPLLVPVANYLRGLRDNIAALWPSGESKPRRDTETDRLVTYVQQHLNVAAKDNSSVISVQFQAGAADAAAAVVNAVMATYLSTIAAVRDFEIKKVDRWVSQQVNAHNQEVAAAELRVTQFVKAHNLVEVQGSLTVAMQLSKDLDQLVIAREDLSRKQAALDTISHGGSIAGASELLESKTVQALKENEAKAIGRMNSLTAYDPRRGPIQSELASIRAQIDTENKLVVSSLSRAIQVARAQVQALEVTVQKESETAHISAVDAATLRQLTADLEAKRQQDVAFSTQAGQLRAAAEQATTAHILFQGVPPQLPTHSFGVLSLLLGFFAGVSGSAGIVVFRAATSTTISSADEMETATGLSVFGALPDVKRFGSGNIALTSQVAPIMSETFRAMWLAMRPQQNEGIAVVVTSSDVKEGKTTIATALAHRFADDGFRVLLIDADLRRPRLSTESNPRPTDCLESVLNNDTPLKEAILPVKAGLDCLLNKGRFGNPLKVLSSDRFAQIVAASRRNYDFVIMDSPPVLHVADAVVLAKLCQHIIFIVQAGRLPNGLVNEATRRFDQQDRAKMLTLLTRVRPSHSDRRDYYSGYAAS